MKKLILLALIAIGMNASAIAQQKERRESMTPEQRIDLRVKKMALDLDLTDAQQKDIRKLMSDQQAKREKAIEERKALKDAETKRTADEVYKMKSAMLDEQIAQKAQMKKILNAEQYSKWEKTKADRQGKMHKRLDKKGHRSAKQPSGK